VEPFDFDARPKPFHRLNDRMDHEQGEGEGEGEGEGHQGRQQEGRGKQTASSAASTWETLDESQSQGQGQGAEASPPGSPESLKNGAASPGSAGGGSGGGGSDEEGQGPDVVGQYQQKQQLLTRILSSDPSHTQTQTQTQGSPGRADVGVDTSGLCGSQQREREAGWLWSPNSKSQVGGGAVGGAMICYAVLCYAI
jgi:hypothetical protein